MQNGFNELSADLGSVPRPIPWVADVVMLL